MEQRTEFHAEAVKTILRKYTRTKNGRRIYQYTSHKYIFKRKDGLVITLIAPEGQNLGVDKNQRFNNVKFHTERTKDGTLRAWKDPQFDENGNMIKWSGYEKTTTKPHCLK